RRGFSAPAVCRVIDSRGRGQEAHATSLMEILLSSKDAGLRAELDRDGHTVVVLEAASPPPTATSARVAVIDGLEEVARLRELPCHVIALVEPDEVARIPDCPRALSDFV